MVRSLPHRIGKMQFNNGNEYRGAFVDRRAEGIGAFQTVASMHEGQWAANQR